MEQQKLIKKFAKEIIRLHNECEDGRFACDCSLCKKANEMIISLKTKKSKL